MRDRSADERGFTILEVTMVSAILLLVMAAFFSVLLSLTKTEQRTDALVSNEQDARFVLNDLARDLRSANPLRTFPTISEYVTKVKLDLGTAPAVTRVQWVYDTNTSSPGYRTLSRQTLDPVSGAVLTTTTRLRNIRNAERGIAMFGYTSQSGTDLITAGQPGDVGSCTIQVGIVITADSNPGPEPFTVESDVQLRNRLPGGVGCG